MALQSKSIRPIHIFAVTCMLFGSAQSSIAAISDGGGDELPASVKRVTLGSMTWGFYEDILKTYPNESADVTAAMNQAVNYYNTVTSYKVHVPVTYVTWGGVTAQASYQGSIQFGYMRSARTAQHELAHFMGMQPWVNGGKATWGSFCNGGWSGANGLARMSSFVSGAGIGCSGDNGHFWDYGLNQDSEYNWLSKGRNIAIVGAMRADVGLSDGSTLPETPYRLVSKATGVPVADKNSTESGEIIEARSTVSKKQVWQTTLQGGYLRLKNLSSQRRLDGAGSNPVLLMAPSSVAAYSWEMIPTNDGYFMLRNQLSNKCLKSAGSTLNGAALALADCDTSWTPASTFEFSLAAVPVAGAAYSTPLPSDAAECAAENQNCQMPDNQSYTVYYGANGTYTIRTGVTGSLACNNTTFGDPMPWVPKRCYRSANTSVAIQCATEAQVCAMPDSNRYTVFYGVDGKYVSRTGVTGSVSCSTATFGDPAPGQTKQCFWLAESITAAPPSNVLPSVSLTAPANNAKYTQGAVISFAATAVDTDGTIAKVELYDNGKLIGTDSNAPFSWTWSGAAAGAHVFTAKATDNSGAAANSAGVNVVVNVPSTLSPPSGAVKCANQNGSCTLPSGKTATVWYGARSSYKVLTGMTGSVACNNSAFGGDPIWYTRKVCYYVSN